VIPAIDSKPVRDTQVLMRNSGQVHSGGRESVTIIRFQQESTAKIQWKSLREIALHGEFRNPKPENQLVA